MSFSDPSNIGGERVSKAPFRRPEVGLYLCFFRPPERLFGGCTDMAEETNPNSLQECGWSRVVVGKQPNVADASMSN